MIGYKNKIKILIVDDSFLIRKILIDILKIEKRIEIIGEAKTGKEAIRKIELLRPDVVTLDFNMPEGNGDEVVKTVMGGNGYKPAIIMLSALTSQGAKETLRCLRLGAIDFVPKPSGDEIDLDIKKVQFELIDKIKAASKSLINSDGDITEHQVERTERYEAQIEFVVIGASTGGPPAVEKVLNGFNDELNITILVVQHMPKQFTKSLAERLDRIMSFSVQEVTEGMIVEQGKCYIAPGDWHVEIREGRPGKYFHLNKKPLRNGFRPSIDCSLFSAAEIYGEKCIGVVLTGMGHDGADGMKYVKDFGGYTIVQDLNTAVVKSMPEAVMKKGAAMDILRLDKIPKKIKEINLNQNG